VVHTLNPPLFRAIAFPMAHYMIGWYSVGLFPSGYQPFLFLDNLADDVNEGCGKKRALTNSVITDYNSHW
jgi:hypothetical protein